MKKVTLDLSSTYLEYIELIKSDMTTPEMKDIWSTSDAIRYALAATAIPIKEKREKQQKEI